MEAKRRKGLLTFSLLLWSSLILLKNQGVNSEYAPFGFQSGANLGSRSQDSYAGSLSYDRERQLLYVTGGTYIAKLESGSASESSDCVISVLKMPDPKNTTALSNKFMDSLQLGISDVNEVCSAIEVYSPIPVTDDSEAVKSPALLGIGHTEPGGMFTELKKPYGADASVYGFSLFMDLPFGTTGPGTIINEGNKNVIGGEIFHNDKVQYPVAIAHNMKKNYVFVAMLSSSFNSLNSGYNSTEEQIKDGVTDHYDMTAGGGYTTPKMGKDFSFTLKKVELKTKGEIALEQATEFGYKQVFDVKWTREYQPIGDPQPRIADIMFIPTDFHGGFLIFAGTTHGYGEAFGSPSAPLLENDIDGFITKLHSSNGKVPKDISSTYSKRIQSLEFGNSSATPTSSGEIDEIKGLCYYESPLSTAPTHFYVVGSTTGFFKDLPDNIPNIEKIRSPFVMKISVDTMETEWVQQILEFEMLDAVAYSCSVTPDNGDVHIAGTVYGGNVQEAASKNSDIFVASYSASSGLQHFMKSFGSKEDDWLARGKGITCDKDGNAIILASTRGQFHRPRSDDESVGKDKHSADFVVLSVRRGDGYILKPHDASDNSFQPKPPVQAPKTEPKPEPEPTTTGTSSKAAEVFMIVVLCCVFFGLFFFMIARIYIRHDIEYDGEWDRKHDDVMQYLEDFNDKKVELHIRHSATGGIHGIYDFDNSGYEYEKNTVEVTSNLTSAAADHIDTDTDAILKDALFMEDDKDSKKGPNNSLNMNGNIDNDYDEKNDRRQSYLGLVDSYNQTWDERSPHAISTTNQTSYSATVPPPNNAFLSGQTQEADIEGDYDSGDDQIKETWGKEIV